jgi:hypothetical protein
MQHEWNTVASICGGKYKVLPEKLLAGDQGSEDKISRARCLGIDGIMTGPIRRVKVSFLLAV